MKYKELIDKMTLEEKASLCSGRDFWHTKPIARLGLPSIMLTDGPHGLRKQGGKTDQLGLNRSVPATCFPTASAAANSWDTELIEEMGKRLGLEAKAENVGVVLGPGVNIKRSPLCGRNFEYYSEDPYLAGKCADALIRGIQSNGISACVKHFAANSQELLRMTNDSVVDERTLREIYLPAFETAVREGNVRCLMTSYNRLNGCYTNESTHLLQDILFGDWGYRGMVVTDWGGDNDRVLGLIAGDHLEMPGTKGDTDRQIVSAVRSGTLSEAILDERVDTLLDMIFSASAALKGYASYDRREHHAFAAKLAAECAVLLKNEGGILPIKPGCRVAVIGDFAKTPRYQGAGSSHIEPTMLDNGLDALKNLGVNVVGYAQGFRRFGGGSKKLLREALRLAGSADIVLLWLGLDEGSEAEGADRTHMRLPENQITLLTELKKVNPRIAVVLSGGSAVETDWDADAQAVLYAGLGGQAGASAVAELLTGRVNPSGKLAETFPLRLEDTPCANYYPGREATSEYREGLYVGYRYYDTAGVPVKYPFGFGLSYTNFEYADLCLDDAGVSFTVKNTGSVAGAEVAQVYIAPKCGGVFRPKQELRGFARVYLEPGESRFVRIELSERAFAYWNTAVGCWTVEGGSYEVLVGSSSRDIRLRGVIEKAGDGVPAPHADKALAPYRTADIKNVPDESFSALLGRPIPPRLWDRSAPLDFNSAIVQGAYLKRGLGKVLYMLCDAARRALLLVGNKAAANNVAIALSLPYRGLARFTGFLTEARVRALVRVINREKGALRGFFRAGKD